MNSDALNFRTSARRVPAVDGCLTNSDPWLGRLRCAFLGEFARAHWTLRGPLPRVLGSDRRRFIA